MPLELRLALIECALEKLVPMVLGGTFRRHGSQFIVSRGKRVGDVSDRLYYVYCVSSSERPSPIAELIKSFGDVNASKLVLIGSDEAGESRLRTEGFSCDWETPIYAKLLDGQVLGKRNTLPPHLSIRKITEADLSLVNSFAADYYISPQALAEPSIVNWLLSKHGQIIGKIQFSLCPPYGAFCFSVAVREDSRRQGHFCTMMRSAEAFAAAQSLPQMMLFSGPVANEYGVYPRLSYRPVGFYKSFVRQSAEVIT